jgi:hypothetical protein
MPLHPSAPQVMDARGGAITAIAALVFIFGGNTRGATAWIPYAFDEAERFFAEAEKRYGEFKDDL